MGSSSIGLKNFNTCQNSTTINPFCKYPCNKIFKSKRFGEDIIIWNICQWKLLDLLYYQNDGNRTEFMIFLNIKLMRSDVNVNNAQESNFGYIEVSNGTTSECINENNLIK